MTAFLDKNSTFYHGTWENFDRFRPLSHFGSLAAAQEVLKSPEKKHEILDTKAEESAMLYGDVFMSCNDIILYKQSGKIIPVQLNLSQTYEIPDLLGGTDINYFKRVVLYHIAHDLKLEDKIPDFYDYIFYEPFNMSPMDVKKRLTADTLYEPITQGDILPPDQINMYHLCYQRMIQYFEHLGYDGFHYMNRCEDCGHTSYVVFRPENIARLDKGQKITPKEPLKKYKDFYVCHKISRIEQSDLQIMEGYYKCSVNFRKGCWDAFNLSKHPSVLKSAIRTREYYTNLLVNEIFPKIENIGTQPKYGYHGLYTHSFQVAQYAIELAMSVGTDPLPVMLGAALHDIARTHDDDDLEHGPKAAEIARKFLKKNYSDLLFPGTIDKIVYAIKYHTIGTIAPDLISACIWDADRIRLSHELGYDEKYFNTAYGKYVAGLKPVSTTDIDAGKVLGICPDTLTQEKYIENQNKFLRYHGIKMR